MSTLSADWNPEQYRRFQGERAQPFHDLLALIRPAPFRRAVDLGCGPGELTVLAAEQLGVGEMVGIDNSRKMLEAAHAHACDRVRFEAGDIGAWPASPAADHDLVLAAASLQWVPDHAGVLKRWTAALAPGGQLAVQVPDNAAMPSHTIADRLANSSRYVDAFLADGPPLDPVAHNVLQPQEYSQLLFDLGFAEQHVHLRVYPHVLASTRHIVEWVKGTTLTRFERRLPPDVYAAFLVDYERELLAVLGDHQPQFFPFRRILFWAQLPG